MQSIQNFDDTYLADLQALLVLSKKAMNMDCLQKCNYLNLEYKQKIFSYMGDIHVSHSITIRVLYTNTHIENAQKSIHISKILTKWQNAVLECGLHYEMKWCWDICRKRKQEFKHPWN